VPKWQLCILHNVRFVHNEIMSFILAIYLFKMHEVISLQALRIDFELDRKKHLTGHTKCRKRMRYLSTAFCDSTINYDPSK
jgi:hypothetical protein